MHLHRYARPLIVRRLGVAVVGCLGVVTVLASPPALASTVRNGRLDISGLTRRAGRQSIVLHARLDALPAKRVATAATLTIGDTVLAVRATVGQTGLLAVRAQHLDLAAELPDFGTATLDVPPPLNAHVRFVASDCVPAVRGHRLGCPASLGAPVVPCGCSQKTGTVRRTLRDVFAELEKDHPYLKETLLSAMGKIETGRLLDLRFLDLDGNAEPSVHVDEDQLITLTHT